MVDRDVLSSRLSVLEEYLAELRAFRTRSREEFVREPALHHLAERYLHLACEAVSDIASHLIADSRFRQPENYRDAIEVLAEERVIERDVADRLAEWMGFRNVLVHLYSKIDHGRAYDAITRDLGDLEDFARSMARFL
jgi:uncharacterized protein YutE (UPF0331/DUF86 family)